MTGARRNFTSISSAGRDNAQFDPRPNPTQTMSDLDRAPTTRLMTQVPSPRPAAWAVVLAFALIYVSWGTTYLAIREGVHNQGLPPCLFGGTRVAMAGLVLLAFLAVRGEGLRFAWSGFRWVALTGLLLFVGGNGLITAAERTVESGIASVLAATTPLW